MPIFKGVFTLSMKYDKLQVWNSQWNNTMKIKELLPRQRGNVKMSNQVQRFLYGAVGAKLCRETVPLFSPSDT